MKNRHGVLTSGSERLEWLPAGDFIWVGLVIVLSSPVWLFLKDAEIFRALFLAGLGVLFCGLSFFYAKRSAGFAREDERDPPDYLVRPGALPSAVWLALAVIAGYFLAR